MKRNGIFLLIFLLFINFFKCNNPTEPENHAPKIISLMVFPEIIGVNDSVIVICEAIDIDGDTLVYDWVTDSRLRIKGSPYTWMYHTSKNSRVFYPTKSVNLPLDTVWVQCGVRDVKGGGDKKIIRFLVKE